MRLNRYSIDSHRRPMLAGLLLVFALLVGAAGPATAQDPATPAKPTVAFQNDAGIVLIYVKADKTADFEEMLTKLKDGLAKSEAADLKQVASTLKFLKAPNGPAPAGNALYVMLADPAVKDAEYWLLSNLYKLYPAESQAVYQKWTEVKGTVNPVIFDLAVAARMQ